MIKRILACSVCLAGMIGTTSAQSAPQGSWYARGDVGVGLTGYSIWDDEAALALGGGIGYKYSSMFRTDVTFDAAIDYEQRFFGVNVDLDAYNVMLNGYLDFPMGAGFEPYVGVGVGYGWGEASAAGITVDDDGFALGGMAGVAYNLTHNIALDLGYKYRRIFIGGEDFDDHLLRGGVRFYFN